MTAASNTVERSNMRAVQSTKLLTEMLLRGLN